MSARVNSPRLKPQLKVTFETYIIKIDLITCEAEGLLQANRFRTKLCHLRKVESIVG